MEVRTKHNLYDIVYTLIGDVPRKHEVISIQIRIYTNHHEAIVEEIQYELTDVPEGYSAVRDEESIFKTEEDLLEEIHQRLQ